MEETAKNCLGLKKEICVKQEAWANEFDVKPEALHTWTDQVGITAPDTQEEKANPEIAPSKNMVEGDSKNASAPLKKERILHTTSEYYELLKSELFIKEEPSDVWDDQVDDLASLSGDKERTPKIVSCYSLYEDPHEIQNWSQEESLETFESEGLQLATSESDTGDNSDVDVETVTEDSSSLLRLRLAPPPPYVTSLPGSHPHLSPTINSNTHSISSLSALVEKVRKERKGEKLLKHRGCVNDPYELEQRVEQSISSQVSYSHVLCTCSTTNFHTYAKSPVSTDSTLISLVISNLSPTATGQRTAFQTKRANKRKSRLSELSEEHKHHHNQLERYHRQKLNDLFLNLQDKVPSISRQSKVSKILILKEAAHYITELQALEDYQAEIIANELRQRAVLQKEVLTRKLCFYVANSR